MPDRDVSELLGEKPAPAAPAGQRSVDDLIGGVRPHRGAGEAFSDQLAQGGLFGFGDEIYGAGRAMTEKLANLVGAEKHPESFGELYRKHRDIKRQEFAEEKHDQPAASAVGGIAGSLLPMLIPGVGAASMKSLPSALVSGGVLGGASGLGGSDADLTKSDVVQRAKLAEDMLKGSSLGAAGGAIGYGAGQVVGPLIERLAQKLRGGAIGQGRRVLTGGAEPLSVKTPIADSSVEEAFRQGAIKPLGTTAKAADVLADARESVGDTYGKLIDQLEAQGVTGPSAQALAAKMSQRGADLSTQSLGTGVPELYSSQAGELLSKPPPAFSMPERGITGPLSDRLGLKQAENIKRSLQDQAKYGGFTETLKNEGRRDIASMMRQGVEDSVAEAGKANPALRPLTDAFVPVKQQLARLIEASNAAEKGVAQAARRKAVSFSDSMMASGGMAHAGPAGAAAAGLTNNMLRNRGTSTAAWGMWKGANMAERMAAFATSNPGAVGKFAPVLLNASRRGPDALAVTHYSLSQDPEYQALQRVAAKEQDQ